MAYIYIYLFVASPYDTYNNYSHHKQQPYITGIIYTLLGHPLANVSF